MMMVILRVKAAFNYGITITYVKKKPMVLHEVTA